MSSSGEKQKTVLVLLGLQSLKLPPFPSELLLARTRVKPLSPADCRCKRFASINTCSVLPTLSFPKVALFRCPARTRLASSICCAMVVIRIASAIEPRAVALAPIANEAS
tara:strand:+ start:2325 stop:2654 length:330 start_codon:yes stop_codon:yes gene_type:complete